MNCEQAREQLEHLTNGKLAGEQARAVRLHFAECGECAARLTPSHWVEILPVIDEAVEPSGNFAVRFRAKLNAQPPKRWKPFAGWGWVRPLAAAGTLAALIFAGVFVVRYPITRQDRAAYLNDFQVAENLPLLEDMAVVSNLDLLEDFDTIEDLPQLMHDKGIN